MTPPRQPTVTVTVTATPASTPTPTPTRTVEPTPEPVGEEEALSAELTRQIQVLALGGAFEATSARERYDMCFTYGYLGSDGAAALVNAELAPEDQFPTDVVTEVFTQFCG